jgi:hypothetical protein
MDLFMLLVVPKKKRVKSINMFALLVLDIVVMIHDLFRAKKGIQFEKDNAKDVRHVSKTFFF